jgi:hypothetical protein
MLRSNEVRAASFIRAELALQERPTGGEQRDDYFDTHSAPSYSRPSHTLNRHHQRLPPSRHLYNRIPRRYSAPVTTAPLRNLCLSSVVLRRSPDFCPSAPDPTQQHSNPPQGTPFEPTRSFRRLPLAPSHLPVTALRQRVPPVMLLRLHYIG